MPRRPLLETVSLNARVPRGLDAYWRIMLDLHATAGTWTVADIDRRCNVETATIRGYCRSLVAGGIAETVGEAANNRGGDAAQVYRLLQTPLIAPRVRRDGTVLPEPQQATLWRTLRMAKTVTVRELAELASTDDRPVRIDVAKRWLGDMMKAGIVTNVTPGTGRTARATYRLVRDLGPEPPRILRLHMVYDPNSRRVLGEPTATVPR